MRDLAIALAFALALPSVAAEARSKQEEAIRQQAESSLLVTGTIDIDANGKVVAHALDKAKTLPKGIVDMTARLAPNWTFEPIALPAKTIGRSKMSLQYVAKQSGSGEYQVELRSASFDANLPPEQQVTIARRGRMPEYPSELQSLAINGTVYVAVQVGRDGKVMNIDASHVNLRTVGSEADMALWREALAKSSIKAIRSWSFAPPTAGQDANAPHWIGMLPVSFEMMGSRKPRPGQWETYLPGPRKLIPWKDSVGGATADNTDALLPNQFHTAGSGRRLIGPLAGG
jgi:hypothetical protein